MSYEASGIRASPRKLYESVRPSPIHAPTPNMMPSRGIHIARGKLPRINHLSSTPRSNLRIASSYKSSVIRASTPWTRSIPIAIPVFAAIRHASTTPAQQAQQTTEAAAAATAPPPAETAHFSNIDTITLDHLDVSQGFVDPSAIPEQLGYLQKIGLEYGYGPTSMIEWIVENAHVTLGLPWWGSICLTALTMRLVLLPFFIKQSDQMARQQALSSVTKPFFERMAKAKDEGNSAGVMQAMEQYRAIHKRAGIKQMNIYAPMVAQGILGYCGFKLMRAMATLPVPGLKDGGFLWITDLTMTDGYLLLPLMMAATMHLVFRTGGESGAMVINPGMRNIMLYVFPAMIFGITAFQPGAVALWFCGSGAIGIAQGKLLQNRAVREKLGIAPIYTPKPGESYAGGMMGALSGSKMKEMLQAKSTGEAAAPTPSPSGASAGKSATFMNTTYQAPNIQTQRSSPTTIDTTLVQKPSAPQATDANSDMVQPGKAESAFSSPFAGVSQSVKASLEEGKQIYAAMTAKRAGEKKGVSKSHYNRGEARRFKK